MIKSNKTSYNSLVSSSVYVGSDVFGGSDGKGSACNVGDPGLIPGSGRAPREGRGNPLQYSRLENPMHRGAWWATARRLTELDKTERLTLSL